MSGDNHDPLQEVHETLTTMGVDAPMPPEDDIRYDDDTGDSGDAGYSEATDSLHLDEDGTATTAGHELLHYAQAVYGVGRPRPDHGRSVQALRQTADNLEDELGEDILESMLPYGDVLNDTDAKIAAIMYASDEDFAETYEETVGSGGDANDFLDAVQQDTAAYENRMDAVLGPIGRRVQQLDQLPLDTEGETDAFFYSLWDTSQDDGPVTGEDMFDQIYSGWDEDEAISLAEALQGRDDGTAVLDAVEARIQEYDKRREDGMAPEEAAGSIIQEGLERFELTGRELGLRGEQREYVAGIEKRDYTGFESGDELVDLLEKGDAFRQALDDVQSAFNGFESAYRSLHRDQAEQDIDGEDKSHKIEQDRQDMEIMRERIHDTVEEVREISGLPGEDAFVDAIETLVTSYVAVLDEHEHTREDLDTGYLETGEGRELITRLRTAGDDDLANAPVSNPISSYITEDLAEDDDRFELKLGDEGAMEHLSRLFAGDKLDEILADNGLPEEETERIELDRRVEDSDMPPGYVRWLHDNEPGDPDGKMFQ